MRFQFSGPPQQRGFGCACVLCLPGLSGSGSQRLGRPLPGCGTPCPSAAPARTAGSVPAACACSEELVSSGDPPGGGGGFSGSLQIGTGGLFAVWEGVASLGLEFSPFPSPLPPTSIGDGPALLWSFSVPLFCKRLAVCSDWLIFPCSPTV